MIQWLILPLLICAITGATATSIHGRLHVEFIQYAVPDSRLASGRYCDSIKLLTWERRVSACDPQVNLCLGAGPGKSCSIGTIALPWVKNSDAITFGHQIGSVTNPVVRPFSSLPDNLPLKATVYDHDRVGENDLIEVISGSVKPDRKKTDVLLRGRTLLKLRIWFTCEPNYYGYLCRMYNYCHSNPCGVNGNCVNQPLAGAFKCRCHTGWTGRRCGVKKAVVANPCAGRKTSRFHSCRVRYRGGRPQLIAIEFVNSPAVLAGRCVMRRRRRLVTGAAASKMCRRG